MAASAAPNVVIAQTYRVVNAAGGASDMTVIHNDSSKLVRGEQLHYSVVATNQGSAPAYAVIAAEALPIGTHLLPGTISPRAQVSTDGGRTWSFASAHRATWLKINAVRWILARPLKPGANATFGYDVTVDAA